MVYVWLWLGTLAALASFASIIYRRRGAEGVLFQLVGGGVAMFAWFVFAINAGSVAVYEGSTTPAIESYQSVALLALLAGAIMFLDLLVSLYGFAANRGEL